MPKKWSKKYKRSIDCNNPKGFSQKAHCAGRKKKESKMSSKLEELVGKPITEEQFDEAAGEKDACYRKVKARYDVWPSAYASGALVKCRKVGAKNWGNKSKKEGVYEKNKGKTLYGKDLVNYFVKRFKYSTRDATAVANKLKDVGFKVPKVLPFNESVNEVDAVTQKKIDKLVADKKKVIDRQKKVKDFQMKNQLGNKIDNYNRQIRKLRGESVKEGYSMRDLGLSPFFKKLNPDQRQAVSIALIMGGNMSGAIKAIEKIKKGLSKDKKVKNALRMANEGFASDAQRRAAFASGYKAKGKKKKKEGVSEKVDTEMKKIYQLLIKYGNSAKDATAMIKKNLKYVNKTYRNSTPRGKAVALVGLQSLGESVKEADLGLTYKKGKTVKVKHKKSGKTLVIIDKPVVKKEYEKIGYYEVKPIKLRSKSGMGKISHLGIESIDEARGTCWVGYQQIGMKEKNGRMVPNCVKEITELYYEVDGKGHGYTFEHIRENDLNEAEYQGRKVKLGKIMQGDAKKFKVYVKNPKGNVVKVNFGQGGDAKGGTMRIRKDNPKARKSFRARHNCDNPGPRHKARYWSCRKW